MTSAIMHEIHINERETPQLVAEALRDNVVMVQMPTVYVLIAPASSEGAERLNGTKARQPNKNYGTALGSLEDFYDMAIPGSLPDELNSIEAFKALTGSFIRMSVADQDVNTVMVRGGTHQGLLLEGAHRELFRYVEDATRDLADPSIVGGHRFAAPLCTSANVSGDPEGSITDWERAWHFGKSRKVPLVVRCDETPSELGSYPIFWLKDDSISVERDGPGLDRVKAVLPSRLFH